MRNKDRSLLWSAILTTLLATPSIGNAGLVEDLGRLSLRGLKGVYVSVERLDPEIRKDGLGESKIQQETVAALKRAGIRILSKEDWFEKPGKPMLYINAHVLKLPASREYIYSIHIALKQDVYLQRDPIAIEGAATWTSGALTGITGRLEKIRTSILKQVSTFIRAYRSANG